MIRKTIIKNYGKLKDVKPKQTRAFSIRHKRKIKINDKEIEDEIRNGRKTNDERL